jgi:hypothetical protein
MYSGSLIIHLLELLGQSFAHPAKVGVEADLQTLLSPFVVLLEFSASHNPQQAVILQSYFKLDMNPYVLQKQTTNMDVDKNRKSHEAASHKLNPSILIAVLF